MLDPARDAAPVNGRVGIQERVLLVGFALLLWLTRFSPIEAPATPELDASWAQALGYALVHGMQFGVDVVFTYGPLGWFAHSAWEPTLEPWKLWFFEVAFRLALTGFFVHALTRVRGAIEKLLFALVLLVPDPGIEAYYFAAVAVLGAWLLERDRRALATFPVWLLLAIVACIKFTYMVAAGCAAACVVARLLAARERRKALEQALLGAAALLLVWCACRQAPWNLVPYVVRSWTMAQGYADAMGHEPAPLQVPIAVASLALGLASVAVVARTRAELATRGALFALVGFLAFKGGLVMAGTTALTCFGFASLAPQVFVTRDAASSARTRAGAVLRVAACVLALWGYQRCQDLSPFGAQRPFAAWNERLAFGFDGLTRWDIHRAEHVSLRRALAEEHALPLVRETVGSESIDVLPYEIGQVLLNDLAWRPRPVIQSYAAYTPALLELNAEHFRGERAPKYVLLRAGTIDHRLPGADDAGALEVIVERYRIVLAERSWLLLARRDEPAPPRRARETVFAARVRFGEDLALPRIEGAAVNLRVEIPKSLRGRLHSFFVSTPQLFARVETDEGFVERFRAVRGELEHGLLVDPWLGGPEGFESVFTGSKRPRMSKLRINCDPEHAADFAGEAEVVLERVEGFELPPARPELAGRLRFPMFDPPPDHFDGALAMSRGSVGAVGVYVVHAPSELGFDVGEGRWRVTARYGLLPGAWEQGSTDGAAFLIGFRSAAGQGTLWRRVIDPQKREEDRPPQLVEHDFDLPPGATLLLRTNPGPAGDGSSDWCYWTDVRITRAP